MNEATQSHTRPKGTRASAWAKWLLISGLVLVIAGLVAPSAGQTPMIAMLLLSIGLLLFIVAAICGTIGLIRSGGTGGDSSAAFAWAGIAAGVVAIINVILTMGSAGGAPIHDISTDTENPPPFVAIAELRNAAIADGEQINPPEYSGGDTAEQQQAAYPELETLVLLDPRAFVFDTALEVADDMGWEIVASDLAEGRIEATATTPFVGFKDDVVIRIRAEGPRTFIDVRSKSRIGMGDMGVNAKRIVAFTDKLLEAANP